VNRRARAAWLAPYGPTLIRDRLASCAAAKKCLLPETFAVENTYPRSQQDAG